ncbi:hypothetical protein SAJA_11545 [Salinisphaera japonica YTM-1]|uniref:Uncharacterized protein n=1 Tax=Salinisphaera japonica YTM-1 TaxID=1209778 RepID=A0A423PKK8_9GAMM|nr:hypothetical protein SAJA_11545 [Salinisphaera japonica YTM-1]
MAAMSALQVINMLTLGVVQPMCKTVVHEKARRQACGPYAVSAGV